MKKENQKKLIIEYIEDTDLQFILLNKLEEDKSLENIKKIHTNRQIYTLNGMEKLPLLSLKKLSINYTKKERKIPALSYFDVSPLKNCTNLEEIHFNYNLVSSFIGFSELKKLKKLKFLSLESCEFQYCDALDNLINLEELYISGNIINNNTLNEMKIKNLKDLKHFNAEDMFFNEDTTKFLPNSFVDYFDNYTLSMYQKNLNNQLNYIASIKKNANISINLQDFFKNKIY